MMNVVSYWIMQSSLKIFAALLRSIFFLSYWRKGKPVPIIQNPLLLKSATQLAKEIREGKLKCVDVILSYIERIEEVEPYINATTQCCFSEALEEAKEVDALVVSGKFSANQLASEKPLLGVPISIKLLLKVKGLKCNSGSLLFKDLVSSEDSVVVSLMKQAGAIVIATTNTPEMGLYLETTNLLHGKTRNPYQTSRNSGGSSGGESALIAAAGSVLGLGNDLLGSIRIPAHFTGIFGHKPTTGLVSNQGCFPQINPEADPFLTAGPMCRYAEDLLISMKILASQSEHEINFVKKMNFSKLKILYMEEIRSPLVTGVDEEIAHALRRAVSCFQTRYNATSEKLTSSLFHDAARCMIHILLAAVTDIKAVAFLDRGENINPKKELFKSIFGKSIISLGPLVALNFSKFPVWWYNKKKIPYYQEMLKAITAELDYLLDENTVLMLPTFPVVAPYHREIVPYIPSSCYTGIFNVVGLPATQCPLGINHQGLPFGIQIVGRKNNDALTIACAVKLEEEFGGWVPPGPSR